MPQKVNQEEKSNYQKLNENTQAVMAFADSIPHQNSFPLNFEDSIIIKENKVSELIEQRKIGQAIMLLDEIKDNKAGIIWHQSTDLGNGTRALVRDARLVNPNSPDLKNEAGEKYAMQVLNQARGASLLIENTNISPNEKDRLTKQLIHCCRLAAKDAPQLNHNNVQTYNTIIADSLKEAGIENGVDKLIFSKEIGNIYDEHKHVVTLSNVRDKQGKIHTVTEAEIMMNGLTEKQKAMYTSIADQKPGMIANGENMEWYNKMPEYKRKLVHDVASKIANGDKILPTQLLSDLPGIKNAYQKVTGIKTREGNEKSEIISKNMHSGTPATKSKIGTQQERDALVADNIEQLSSFALPKSKLHLNILNSKTPFNIGKDNFIYNQVEKAVSGLNNVVTTASPINTFAMLVGGGREQKQFNNTLVNLGEKLNDKGLENVSKYLKQKPTLFNKVANKLSFSGLIKTTEYKAREELKKLEEINPKLSSVLKSAMDAKDLLTSPAIVTKGNVNLNIGAAMNSVENSIKLENGAIRNHLGPENGKNLADQIPTRTEFCKSGKDRTGLVQMENTHIAICNHLGIDRKSDLAKSNYMSQAASGHTQQLAGMQGGTLGCHTLKVSRGNGISSEQKEILGIINQKSAYGNSKIETLKNKQEADKFRNEFKETKQKHELNADKEHKQKKVSKVVKGNDKVLENFKKTVIKNTKTGPTGMNPKTIEKNKTAQKSI